jgi:integrase
MIRLGWCRTNINRQSGRVKHLFKWATSIQLIPASVYHGLMTVGGLKAGRSDAKESDPVRPVPEAHVSAVVDCVSRQVGAMIQLQALTGARPGEICSMRTCDVDTTGKVWVYRPASHKNSHRGHDRMIFMGPQAQRVLRSFLKPDLQAFCFSPADAEAERRATMHEARKKDGTPLSCGNKPGSNRQRKPRKTPGARYSVEAYCKAIYAGCEKAFGMPVELRKPVLAVDAAGNKIPETGEQKLARLAKLREWRGEHSWHPHQLRHNAATRLRKQHGLDAARAVLGHRTLRWRVSMRSSISTGRGKSWRKWGNRQTHERPRRFYITPKCAGP